MNQPDCLFCKIAAGEIPSACILENSEFKVILDRFPGIKGHVLIIPKTHVENIFDMDPELGGRLFTLAVRLSKTLKETFDME
jgi:histidine triad (HIT) family protein